MFWILLSQPPRNKVKVSQETKKGWKNTFSYMYERMCILLYLKKISFAVISEFFFLQVMWQKQSKNQINLALKTCIFISIVDDEQIGEYFPNL